jgi:quercetin dioxygenase-like cupin family protein
MTYGTVRLLSICVLATAFNALAAEPDPKILAYTLPENIQWKDNAARTNQTAILYGDPAKPGPYAMLIKWKAGNMSRPHYHEHDRFFVVVSGTWWVGTGPKFDPESTKPMPAGTYVLHYANGIHYDGAKQGDAIIALHGMGPVSTIPAEQK